MSESHSKLITVVLPHDNTAGKLLEMLRNEMGLCSSSIHTARGCGTGGPEARQFGVEVEKDIFSVVVDAERADDAFGRIYEFVDMGNRHGGFMFQAELGRWHPFVLPEQPAES